MNEELKALLKEAYDRGATREQLDAITERYNASKKKDEAIPSPSLDGESVSPEIEKKEDTFVEDALASSDFYNPVGKLIKGIPGIAEVYSGVENLVGSVFKAGEMAIRENLFAYASSNPAVAAAQNILRTASPIDNKISDALGAMGDFFMESSERTLLNKQKEYGISEEEISRGIVGNVIDGNIGTASKLTASTIAHQIPQLAAMVATGGTAGAALLGTSAAGNKYAQIQDDPTLSSEEKAMYSLAIGAAEGLAEYMFRTDVSQIRRAFGKKETLDEFKDVLKKQLKKETLLKSTLEEGGEELVVGVVDLLIEDGLRGNFDNWNADAVLELADAALVGGIMGGGVHTVTRGVNALGSSKNERKQSEIKSDINTLNQKKKNATEDQKRVIDELIEEKVGELININTEDSDFYSNFSNEDIKEIISTNKDIREASKKYNVAPSETLKKKYADEIKTLRDKKQNIENKYSETPTRYIKDGKELSRTEFVDMLNAATPEELATGQWGVQNDEEIEQLLTSKLPKDDSQKEERIPSPEQEAEAPVEAEPVVRAGEEEVTPDRDVQEVEEKVTSGEEVFSFVEEITPQQEDVPTGFEGKIKERDFRESEVDLQGLLNTDPDFKEFYDNFKQRYEEGEVEPEGLGLNLVVVDGELLDGYNRAATLLSEGQTKTNAFTAVEKAEPKKAEPKKATPFVPEDVAEIQPQDVVTEKDNEGNSRFFARIPVKDRDVKAYFEVERKEDGTIVRVSDKSYGLARKTLKKRLKAEPSREQIVSQRSTPEYVEAKVAEQPVEDPAKLTEELQGQFGLLTAENPMAKELSEEENAELNKKAEAWLKERNYSPRKVSGRYEGIAENSFFVPNLTMSDAIAFAKEFNQDSVAHSEGLVDQQGKMYARVKSDDLLDFAEFQAESDFVSTVNTAEGAKTFKIGYNFKDPQVDAITATVSIDDLSTVGKFTKAQADRTVSMVGNFDKIIKKVNAPKVKVTFVSGDQQFKDYYKSLTGKKRDTASKGSYIPSEREIIINLSKADNTTLAHEMLHAYIASVKMNRKRLSEFTNTIEAELLKGSAIEVRLAEELSAFRQEYIDQGVYGQGKTKDDPIIAEEFLAQYVGIMSAYSDKIGGTKQVSLIDKIRAAVVKFLTKVGVVDKSLTAKIQNREDALNFINGFVDALEGRVEAIKPPAVEIEVDTATKYNPEQIKGAFRHTYFDKSEAYQKLVDDGKIVHNSSLANISDKAAAITQPDSMVTAKVELDEKTIVDGNGGVFFIGKFGDVWAAAKLSGANSLAKMINDSRKKNGGVGYLLLASGKISKMITSTDGVKASMNILEAIVDRGFIPVSDFRAALTAVGKKYNVDFSGRDSMKFISKDIKDKFLNVSDSTFEKRGFFFEDVVDYLAKNSTSAKENIKQIRDMLGAKKRISFSKQGIKEAIGYVLAERIIDSLPASHVYAYVVVTDEVVVEKTKDHGSYPFVLKQKNGERPVLHLLTERPKAVDALLAKDGSKATYGKIGLSQMGRGSVIVKDKPGVAEAPKDISKEQIDFAGSELLNEFSWTEEVVDPKTGKLKTINRTEKSDNPIGIKFPDGTIALVRSFDTDLKEAQQLLKEVKKGAYPYMDEDQVESKIDLLKKRINDKDLVVELIDGDMKYHKAAKYGRSSMPMGRIELTNNHYDYYFPNVAKILGKDYKAGLMYSPDNTRGTNAVEIYDEFQGEGFGSRLYFSALRLLREQVPGARLISNHDINVTKKAKNFWRSQVNNGLAKVIANTATKQEIEQLGGQTVLKQLKDIGAEYTGDIYELLDPAERTAPSKQYDVVEDSKEQIDWERSEFGRGQVNPAIVNRTTDVQQAAVDLLEGKITNKEYQDTVKFTQAIEAITRFFLPASTKDMKESLDSNKAKLLNEPIEEGKEIGLRLDIPAYKNKNIWIVSVHDKGKSGKSISYGSVAWATDVNFGSNPKVAAFIAAGRNMDTLKKQDKTTIARMLGKWKNFEGKTKEERDAAAIKKVEEIVAIENKYPGASRKGSPWRQIGMNPFRHSFFYDRRNGKPVVSASEVVQIGGLVYAKDVEYADWSSDQFTVDGYYDADGAPVKFQVETQTDKKLVDALEKGEIPSPLYKKSLGEKIYAALFRTPLEMEVLKLQEKKDAKISDLEYQGREIANRIKKYAKTPEALKLANEYLTKEDKKDSAEAILKLPNGQKLLDNLRTARGFIDNISSQLANDPAFEALPDELRLAISENITTYLRAQYKFFTDKSYDIDKRRDPAIQAQFNELVAREIAMLGAMGASDMDIKQMINDSRDDIIEEATQMIDSYISDLKDVKYQPSTTGAGIKMPNAPFRAKKDLPQYIKDLLGEEKNPVNRFAQTTKSLANVLYKGEMINGIIDIVGKDSDYILDEKPEGAKEKQYVKVNDPYSTLDGKYVHKEVMDMVNQKPLYTTDNFWANLYFTTLKLARKSKVIWNVTTWRKNLTGGWYFIMANGVANPGFAKDFARRTKLMFNVRGEEFQVDDETKQLMRIMAKTGLTGKSIDANLIGISQAAFQFGLDGDENAYYERAKKVFNNIAKKDKWLQEKYAAVDDYTKLIIFRSEIQSYAKKLYGKAYDQLTEDQKDNVHEQAAERVKQSTPTFSRLPKWYPKVAVIPVVGDFISFRLESLRSYGENVGNAVSDLKKSQESGLDEVQKKEYLQSGLRRLAGSGAVFALKLGITTFLADLFLDDDDEELEEDAKVLRPEWMDGQTIIPRSIDKDGNVRVYNYSSEDPYGDVSDIFGGTESWSAMIKDFVRPNIAANLIFNLSKGEDIYGGKIADYSDSDINNMIKVLNYTAKQIVVPPTVSSSFRDAYLRSELPKKDKIVNLATTIAERSVIRDYKYNIVDSFVQDLRKIGETRKSYYDYDNPTKRLKQLDEIKQQFDAIVRIGVAKNNFELIDKAEKYMKRHLESLDEEYVLDGTIIKKQ